MSAGADSMLAEAVAARPRLDVVIVNWNAGAHLRRCVESLRSAASELPGLHVIVVDNASTDGSADALPSDGLRLSVLRNDGNLGFARACNQGAARANGDYLLFLNPDTIIPSASALATPLRFLELSTSRDVAIAGVQLRSENGEISRTCTRFPTAGRVWGWMLGLDRFIPRVAPPQFLTEFDHRSLREVDVVMGAFFLMRRAAFDALGGFDQRYFVYYEEVDLARRSVAAGYRTVFLPEPHVTHVGCGTTDAIKATRYFYVTRSRIQYGFAHFSVLSALGCAVGALCVEPFVRVAYALIRGRFDAAAETLGGARRLWSSAPTWLREALARRAPAAGPSDALARPAS